MLLLINIFVRLVHISADLSRLWREAITELSVMKIYLNSHKQRLGVTLLSIGAPLITWHAPAVSRRAPTAGPPRASLHSLPLQIKHSNILSHLHSFTNIIDSVLSLQHHRLTVDPSPLPN